MKRCKLVALWLTLGGGCVWISGDDHDRHLEELSAPEADTGDGGQDSPPDTADTGEQGDSGSGDSGHPDTGDSAQPDTGDSAQPDTGDSGTPDDPDAWVQLAAGAHHRCGRRADGRVECWGYDDERIVVPDGSYIDISAGAFHSCGVLEGGAVTCWGNHNAGGALVPPKGISFQDIDTCASDNCGLTSDGKAACWTNNDGYGITNESKNDFVQVTAGSSVGCGLEADGWVTCWEDYAAGWISWTDKQGSGWSSIDAGTALCVHREPEGLVCTALVTKHAPIPTGVMRHFDAGCNEWLCGITEAGDLTCGGKDWGNGELKPPTDGPYTWVAVGHNHACAIKEKGGIDCWGYNNHG